MVFFPSTFKHVRFRFQHTPQKKKAEALLPFVNFFSFFFRVRCAFILSLHPQRLSLLFILHLHSPPTTRSLKKLSVCRPTQYDFKVWVMENCVEKLHAKFRSVDWRCRRVFMNEMKGETRDPNNDDDSEMKRGGLRKALYKLQALWRKNP